MYPARRFLIAVCLLAALAAPGCVDTTVSEPVPAVQQPDWNQRPIFDAYFAGTIVSDRVPPECKGLGWGPGCNATLDSLTHDIDFTSAATGGGDVFLSSEAKSLVKSYDGASLAPKRSFEHPDMKSPRALTYYRGELFVANSADIFVFSASSGVFARKLTFPGVLASEDFGPQGVTVAVGGIDAAWGELWLTLNGGPRGGGMFVLDAVTGNVKGVHWHLPKQNIDVVWTGCTDAATVTMNLATCASRVTGPGGPAQGWTDLATVPEELGVIAQCRFIQRGDLIQPTPTDTELGVDLLSNDACDTTGTLDGVDAVWGMRWYLTVDAPDSPSDGALIREYGIEPDHSKPWLTPLRRSWAPAQGSSGHPVRFDVAYQARETRVDWSGPLKTKDWLRGTKCANYVVSDGDIFITGKTAERWYEPARGFQKIELRFDGALQDTETTAAGQLCGNTASVPSGVRTVELRAYVNNGSRTVSATNAANFDNTAPTGTLDPTPESVRGAVTLSGSVTDQHSHPHRWRPQILRNGAWQTLCDQLNDQPDQVTHASTCSWNTGGTPDGQYQLRIESVDLASDGGNIGYSGTRPVTVDNTPPDLNTPAPSVGSEEGGTTGRQMEVEMIWQQTDGGSGVDRTVLEYNAAPDGGATGSWQPAQAAPTLGNGDASTIWNTQEVSDGVHRMRATTTDRAGNTKTTEWQTVVSAARRRCPTTPGGSLRRCYAGQWVGEKRSGRGNSQFSRGIRSDVTPGDRVSKPIDRSGGDFSYIGQGIGAIRGSQFLETGPTNDGYATKGREKQWLIVAAYTNGKGEFDQHYYDRVGEPGVGFGPQRRSYEVVIGSDKRGIIKFSGPPESPGRRVGIVTGRKRSYFIDKYGVDAPFQGESGIYARYLVGQYHNAQFRSLDGNWKTPTNATADQFLDPNTYIIKYHNGNRGVFCVADPKRDCTPAP